MAHDCECSKVGAIAIEEGMTQTTSECQKSPPLWLRRDDDHSGRPSLSNMPTMSRECEAISKELQDRYELDDELVCTRSVGTGDVLVVGGAGEGRSRA